MITSATPLFKEQPRAPPTPPTERDYVSFSALSAYRRCPLSYYFRYKLGLPEETVSSSLVYGTAIHRGLEKHFRELLAGNEPPAVKELLARISHCAVWSSGEARLWSEALRRAIEQRTG